MAHNRRKKFTSPFLDTNTISIELSRTKYGYGFTLSGQRPCILTQIKSHASAAGLRSGDYLIAVNGQNVSRSHHDDVVRLITSAIGVLKLDIIENCTYYSSESSDESGHFVVRKEKPRYPYRHRRVYSSANGINSVNANYNNRLLYYQPHMRKFDIHSVPTHTRSNRGIIDLVLKQRLSDIENLSESDTQSSNANGIQTKEYSYGLPQMNKCNDMVPESENGNLPSERAIDVGRVGNWGTDFQYLLDDNIGIKIFSEFLKKEFSYENIQFWNACERFKKLQNKEEMRLRGKEIFDTFLCIGAPEAVNVDNNARIIAERGFDDPNLHLFDSAQKQIFDLMKFDSYQRFLKSDLYKECATLELQGKPLPSQESAYESDIPQESRISKAKIDQKIKKNKKSFIPWNREKSYKMEDKIPNKQSTKGHGKFTGDSTKKRQNYNCTKVVTDDITTHFSGSQSSITSNENLWALTSVNSQDTLTKSCEIINTDRDSNGTCSTSPGQCNRENCHISRIILPDRSTAIVKTQNGEKISEMIQKILEKRNLQYSAVEVFATESDKPLDQNADVSTLGCKEIRVEQRILFVFDMPYKKIVGIRVRPGKSCGDVFRSVLFRYGYKLEHVVLQIANSSKSISLNASISSIDNQRIIVSPKDDLDEWGWDVNHSRIPVAVQSDKTLKDTKRNDNDTFCEKLKLDEIGSVDYELPYEENVKKIDNSNTIMNDSSEKENTISSVVKDDERDATKNGENEVKSQFKAEQNNQQNDRSLLTSNILMRNENISFSDDNKTEAFFRDVMIASQHIPEPVNSVRPTLSPYLSKPKSQAHVPSPPPIRTNATGGAIPKPAPRTALQTQYKNEIKFSKCNLSPIERVDSNSNFVINDIDLDVTLRSLRQNKNFNDALNSDITFTPHSKETDTNFKDAHFPTPQPPSLYNHSQLQTLHNYGNRNDIIRKPPVRRLSSDPPPLPPKAIPRGPPPRPPSRQQIMPFPNMDMNRKTFLENYI